MLFPKPEEYMLPNPDDIKLGPRPEDQKYAPNPTKGLCGDPSKPPRKQYTLMKQAPLPVGQPKYLRPSLSVEDIHGAKSKALYRGVARNILDIQDIDGSKPKRAKERNLSEYNIMDYSDVNNKRSTMNIKIPNLEITKPKDNFYNKEPGKTTRFIKKEWAQDRLDIFKKDQASKFLYPQRFSYADTDAVSWKSHMTKEFEDKLPDHYGVGTIK
uniref:Uncharacterized protein n=1 Tax=Euplotes crassus TaxID=5936 RepID=A0A7S3KN35_EUPCR|mmetsp:Transcript_30974/g.30513  ORF Transcript_30974/g.30513 Transcript_30974/m.30513 type:complete len:213 (+) Transcript_30974:1-639(+)